MGMNTAKLQKTEKPQNIYDPTARTKTNASSVFLKKTLNTKHWRTMLDVLMIRAQLRIREKKLESSTYMSYRH